MITPEVNATLSNKYKNTTHHDSHISIIMQAFKKTRGDLKKVNLIHKTFILNKMETRIHTGKQDSTTAYNLSDFYALIGAPCICSELLKQKGIYKSNCLNSEKYLAQT
jgi:hypothetical protein